jgi:hypothetical protein
MFTTNPIMKPLQNSATAPPLYLFIRPVERLAPRGTTHPIVFVVALESTDDHGAPGVADLEHARLLSAPDAAHLLHLSQYV